MLINTLLDKRTRQLNGISYIFITYILIIYNQIHLSSYQSKDIQSSAPRLFPNFSNPYFQFPSMNKFQFPNNLGSWSTTVLIHFLQINSFQFNDSWVEYCINHNVKSQYAKQDHHICN